VIRRVALSFRQTRWMSGRGWSVQSGRGLAIPVLVGALVAVLALLLVLRADTQTFAARWNGGRDIHLFLQPTETAPEAQALNVELAKDEGVTSARVAVLPVAAVGGGAGYSLLRCCSPPSLYLDVMTTTLNQVSAVEAEIVGRPNVLAVADARSMVAAKVSSYRGWRDLALGACVVIMSGMVGLVIRRPRWHSAAT
jgi:hypothetical protein